MPVPPFEQYAEPAAVELHVSPEATWIASVCDLDITASICASVTAPAFAFSDSLRSSFRLENMPKRFAAGGPPRAGGGSAGRHRRKRFRADARARGVAALDVVQHQVAVVVNVERARQAVTVLIASLAGGACRLALTRPNRPAPSGTPFFARALAERSRKRFDSLRFGFAYPLRILTTPSFAPAFTPTIALLALGADHDRAGVDAVRRAQVERHLLRRRNQFEVLPFAAAARALPLEASAMTV